MSQKPSYRPTVVLNSQGYPLFVTDGSFEFKMGSSVNSGKQGRYTTDSGPPNKNIKNSRKGQIHFLLTIQREWMTTIVNTFVKK